MNRLDVISIIAQVSQLVEDKTKLMAKIPLTAMELYHSDNRNTVENELVYIHLPSIEEYIRIQDKINELELSIAKYDLEQHIKQLDDLISYTRGIIEYMRKNPTEADFLPQQEQLLQSWLKERYELKKELVVVLR